MTEYQEATTSFVNGAKGVVGAVEMLRTAIASGDNNDIDFASDLVAQAADNYLGNTVKYQQKKLDEIAVTPAVEPQKLERAAGDLMAGVLLDVEVANSILVAARAASPTPPEAPLVELDASAARLNNLMNVVALPLGKETVTGMARFHLDEAAVAAVSATPSSDILTAKINFETQVAEVFARLIADSKKVVLAGFEGIRKLNFEQLLSSLGDVGKLALKIPQVSKVVTKALAIVAKAIEKISLVLGVDYRIEMIRDIARKSQQYIQDPTKSVEDLLTFTFSVETSKGRVRQLVEETTADKEEIDRGADELIKLQSKFAEQMSIVSFIIDGVTTTKGIMGFFLPAASTDLVFGSFHILSLSYAVIAGMDFADSEGSPNFVKGVMGISEGTLR